MEMQHNDHFPVAGLEYGVFDVIVQDVNFISAYWREAETCRCEDSQSFVINEFYLIKVEWVAC